MAESLTQRHRDTEVAGRAASMRPPWPRAKLGEVCEVLDSRRKPITKKDRIAGDIPYYGATGIVDHVSGWLFDERLVLLGEDGAKWGAGDSSAFVIEGRSWVNNHAHVLRPNENLFDCYLVHCLNCMDLSDSITGVTVPKLNLQKMCEIELPLPPLPVQREIVARLERELGAVDELAKKFEELEQTAEAEFKAELKETFEELGDVTNGTGGTKGTNFRDSCCISRGGYITRKDAKAGNVPVILGGREPAYYIDHSNHDGPCLVISRSGASAGFVSYWNEPIFVTDGFIVETLAKNDIEFAYYYFKSRQDELNGVKEGGAIPHVTGPKIEAIGFPSCDLPTQRAIVARLDAAKARKEALASAAKRGREAVAVWRKAILKEAFE